MAMARKVIVIGSLNIDIVLSVQRLPQVGETVVGTQSPYMSGGKGGNQAVAAARAGASTTLFGRLGADEFADTIREFLRQNHVDTSYVFSTMESRTGVGVVTVGAQGENTVVIITGANDFLLPAESERLRVGPGDVVVSQFEVPARTVSSFMVAAHRKGATTVLNCAPAVKLSQELTQCVDLLVMNEIELSSMSGKTVQLNSTTEEIVDALNRVPGQRRLGTIVTLGARGAIANIEGVVKEIRARKVRAVDTAGAGDCFVGSLAARITTGEPLWRSVEWANVAASLCVQRPGGGPSMPYRQEVDREIGVSCSGFDA